MTPQKLKIVEIIYPDLRRDLEEIKFEPVRFIFSKDGKYRILETSEPYFVLKKLSEFRKIPLEKMLYEEVEKNYVFLD